MTTEAEKSLLTDAELKYLDELEETYKLLEDSLYSSETQEEDMVLFLLGVSDKDWIK